MSCHAVISRSLEATLKAAEDTHGLHEQLHGLIHLHEHQAAAQWIQLDSLPFLICLLPGPDGTMRVTLNPSAEDAWVEFDALLPAHARAG